MSAPTADTYRAQGWDAYRAGTWDAVEGQSWQVAAWREGHNAAQHEQLRRQHHRAWDPQGSYGPLPSLTLPPGEAVYATEGEA